MTGEPASRRTMKEEDRKTASEPVFRIRKLPTVIRLNPTFLQRYCRNRHQRRLSQSTTRLTITLGRSGLDTEEFSQKSRSQSNRHARGTSTRLDTLPSTTARAGVDARTSLTKQWPLSSSSLVRSAPAQRC